MPEGRGSGWRQMDIHSTGDLVNDWWNRLRDAQRAHYRAANIYAFAHYCLGIIVMGCSFVVLSQTFAGTASAFIGWLSVAAAVGAGAQTFTRPAEISERHRSAASRFSCLRRDLEQFEALRVEGRHPDPDAFIATTKENWQQLLHEVPVLPVWIWRLGGRPDSETLVDQTDDARRSFS